ncbi:MAG: hypothetical protein JSS24_00165, partial [Proteobacteria bacterium]|nr:hypothetical protein [Pseudomonadota bacterium]
MNSIRLGLLPLLLACSGIASAAQSATPASPPASASTLIIGRALSPSPLAEDLRRLTDEVGGRMTGTPAMARAIDWALNAFKAAGVDAHAETYMLPLTWSEGATRLEIVGPVAFPITVVSEGWSAPTPAGGIEAELVHVGDGSEADFARLGVRIRGAILLADMPVIQTWADLTEEYDRELAIKERGVRAGASAMLWIGARDRRLMYRHTDTVDGEISPLPMATLAREDGLRLARLAQNSAAPVRVRLSMPNNVGGPAPERNVVAEVRGREHPEEVVVLGAHLD